MLISKKILIVSLVIIILILSGAAFFIKKEKDSVLLAPKEVFAAGGIVLEVNQGSAILKFEKNQITLTAPAAQEIKKGMEIQTQKNSQAQIIFSNGTVLRLDEETNLILSEFIQTSKKVLTKTELLFGNTFSRVQRLLDKETEYEIETSNTVAVVKGTSFALAFKDNKTKVEVFNKSVQIKVIDPQTKEALKGGETTVEEGKFIESDISAPPTLEKPIEVKTIPDQVKETPWIKSNLEKDQKIEENIKNKAREQGLIIGEIDKTISADKILDIVIPSVMSGQKITSFKNLENIFAAQQKEKSKIQTQGETGQETTEELPQTQSAQTQTESESLTPLSEKVQSTDTSQPSEKTQTSQQTIQTATSGLTASAPTTLTKLSLKSISPSYGYGESYQYTDVVVKGGGFSQNTKLYLSSIALTNIELIDKETLVARVPLTITPGFYDLIASDNEQKITLLKAFEVKKVLQPR